jgi:hypothetical protein
LRARLRVIPPSVEYFTEIMRRRSRKQMGIFAWFADYMSASTLLDPFFACTTRGDATVANVSHQLLAAYDVSADAQHREWLQGTWEDLEPELRPSRELDPGAATRFIDAIERHPEKTRLDRVIGHYRQALGAWESGRGRAGSVRDAVA